MKNDSSQSVQWSSPVRVLVIEDTPLDAKLILQMLKEAGRGFEVETADDLLSGLTALANRPFDVVLLDLSLPDNSGMETVERILNEATDVPVVVLTATDDEEKAVEVIRRGAQDFLVKGRFDGALLARSVRYAIQRQRTEKELAASERKYRSLLDNALAGVFRCSKSGEILYANDCALQMLWPGCRSLPGNADIRALFRRSSDWDALVRMLGTHEKVEAFEAEMVNGADVPLNILMSVTLEGGTISGVAVDITGRRRAEEESRKDREFIRDILESVDEGFIVIDRDYRIILANRAYAEMSGVREEELIGRHCHAVSHHRDKPCFEYGEVCPARYTFMTGKPSKEVHAHLDSRGNRVYAEVKTYPMKFMNGEVVSVIETVNNITERVRLEEQLRQAGKMEAVGQLSGGIAHDFNNILSAIIGYANLIEMRLTEDDPMRDDIGSILEASERAVKLIGSLLAFSRKKIINPKPVNVNDVIRTVRKFMRHVIGEDIELKAELGDAPLNVMADMGEIEQVIVNLCTNARDAMADGGLLLIKTSRVEIDERFVKEYKFGLPGHYARISCIDSGTGMDETTRERIFEPFFTTKEVGKGTGLGLSMAYGIIKQHGGYINVTSEPGAGTTFEIYLPLVSVAAEEPLQPQERPLRDMPTGTETVLIAEDDVALRRLGTTVLREFGYTVIEAADGDEAVEKFRQQIGEIDLIILDVIMPKKTGRQVYDEVRSINPGVKAIFVSGYTADVIHKKNILDTGLDFIMKPVTPRELLLKVREVLDRRS